MLLKPGTSIGPYEVLASIGAGEVRPVAGVERGDFVVGWSAGNDAIYVARQGELPLRLDRIDLASGRRTLFKELIPADRTGLIDIDFINLSADGKAYAYGYRRLLSVLYLATGID